MKYYLTLTIGRNWDIYCHDDCDHEKTLKEFGYTSDFSEALDKGVSVKERGGRLGFGIVSIDTDLDLEAYPDELVIPYLLKKISDNEYCDEVIVDPEEITLAHDIGDYSVEDLTMIQYCAKAWDYDILDYLAGKVGMNLADTKVKYDEESTPIDFDEWIAELEDKLGYRLQED